MRSKIYAQTALAIALIGLGAAPANAQYSPYWPQFRSYMNTPFYGGAPVWQQSHAGGYYDATGRIGVVVPGSELWRYGGTFGDGRPVPNGPVQTNFAGHVLF